MIIMTETKVQTSIIILKYQIKPMYRSHPKGQPLVQTLDFSTIRKTNVQTLCKIQNSTIQFINQPNPSLLLIGIYAILNKTVGLFDIEFNDFPFQNSPKHFQQFCHQKTVNEIFNILKNKGKTVQNMVQLLNGYPLFIFVMECWVRKRGILWLESNSWAECMGNQQQILSDLNLQIRGPLLGLIATCFKMSLRLKFQLFPSADIDGSIQQLGDDTSLFEICIQFKTNNIAAGTLIKKEAEPNTTGLSKSTQCGYLRRSKVVDSETQPRSGNQFKSTKKQRVVQCQKCGVGKKCQCNQLKRKGLGITPKNNQLSTSNNGFKIEPFVFGFLNQNTISKIRETNSNSQK